MQDKRFFGSQCKAEMASESKRKAQDKRFFELQVNLKKCVLKSRQKIYGNENVEFNFYQY